MKEAHWATKAGNFSTSEVAVDKLLKLPLLTKQ